MRKKLPQHPEQLSVAWHTLEIDEVLRRLESSPGGLDGATAAQRLRERGPNTLGSGEGANPLRVLAHQVNNPLIWLLAAAVALSIVVGHPVDAAVIAGVIVLNSLLGFFQEWRAEGALEALRRMSALRVPVLRDGSPAEIDAAEVVPGDVLLLETGGRVPADARIVTAEALQADESAFTGESLPADKQAGRVEEDVPVADRRNMAWMSTSVTGGRGRAVVVETGMRTQMGRIAGDMRSTHRPQTPLQKRMQRLGILLGAVGIALAAVVFGLGLLRGYAVAEMLMFAVAVAVSAIPEGLPAVISVTLALGVRRMAGRGAIIRRLSAVETLGSTTVICSDKTGTLTRNQMTVRALWADGRRFEVTGEGYGPEGEICEAEGHQLQDLPEALRTLLNIGVANNNARLVEEDGGWTVRGNPSEGALLVAARKAGVTADHGAVERLGEVPFSSEHKYMATLHPGDGGAGRVAFVKGAPERLLDCCTHVLATGVRVELDDERRRELQETVAQFASQALRVMAGAFRDFPLDKDRLDAGDVEQDLTLAGLWGMIDPPREESRQAVDDARTAGIRPVMITGDHADTALAIARQIGIAGEGRALSGTDIEAMGKGELARAAMDVGVFARVSPEHKLKVMEALKDHGEVVAMTGDGVNDAPALKAADIGIAMGRAGTEVAKEAADMVLTDDNFATIVHAVEEGRVIYSNLRRVVFYLLSTNLAEILVLVAALVIGLDLPLTAVMLLWINLVTDGVCTVPLGTEPRHRDVLRQPPRSPRESILDPRTIARMAMITPVMAAGTLGLFWWSLPAGLPHARTVAFTVLAAFQWFQALNARSQHHSVFAIGPFSNRGLLAGIAVAVLLQVIVVSTPIGGLIFGTTPLGWREWAVLIPVAASVWAVDEILKALGLHGRPRRGRRRAGADG